MALTPLRQGYGLAGRIVTQASSLTGHAGFPACPFPVQAGCPLDQTGRMPVLRKTGSWQFHGLAQYELHFVRERPLGVVWHGVGLDHALGSFWIDNKKRRARQVA